MNRTTGGNCMPHDLLDDDRIGVPIGVPTGSGRPVPAARPQHEPAPLSDAEPTLRAGETDLGRPAQTPAEVAPLTEQDRTNIRIAEEEQAHRDLAEAEELTASDPALPWLGWFAHPVMAAFLIGSAGLLGLLLYSQTLSILGNLAVQPPWLQYLGYAGLILCGGAVVYAALRLILVYFRLRANRQVRLAGLEELKQRTRLRWLAHAKAAEAKRRLEEYLNAFPINTEKERKQLVGIGFSPEMMSELSKIRGELLDPARFSGSGEWFEQFRVGFQTKLDEAASNRIGYWAKRSGLTTAAAPNGMIDSAATLYFGFALLTDLCRIYHLRAGKAGTAVLLGRVFFNSYLAGQMNEWEKLTEEQINQLMAPHGPLYELTAARVLSKVGVKATSGLLNYFLLARLGKYACRLLRPVG
jgi:putative membrane protein